VTESGATLGRYELRGELGRGGFATVYRGWDPLLRREVAIKALLPHLARDPGLRRRFLAEAQALARLQHVNIVPVYDVGETETQPYFAMALVDGRTLAEVLRDGKRLSVEQVIDLLRSLASALDELHSHGLVHRDVKPQNVMVDGSSRVVLMDLGVARSADSTLETQAGVTLGSPAYMAPEQVRGQPVGPAADIYALGVLSYHLFARRPPFAGDTPAVLHAQVYDPPPPLRELRPALPQAVYAAIDLALAKDPARRPSSARQFVDLLCGEGRTALLPSDAPTTRDMGASPGMPVEPAETPRGMRRRFWWLALAGIAVLLLASATAALAVLSRQGAPEGAVGRPTAAPGSLARASNAGQAAIPTQAPPVRSPVAGAHPAPSEDCTPTNLPTGTRTACSIFLDGEVSSGTQIIETVTGPSGATVASCRSEAAGLTCGRPEGSSATVTCVFEQCRIGARFTVDVTAPTRGVLAETVTIKDRDGSVQSFTHTGKATFGAGR